MQRNKRVKSDFIGPQQNTAQQSIYHQTDGFMVGRLSVKINKKCLCACMRTCVFVYADMYVYAKGHNDCLYTVVSWRSTLWWPRTGGEREICSSLVIEPTCSEEAYVLDDDEMGGRIVEAVSLRCRESKSGTMPGEEYEDITKRDEQLKDEGEGESAEAYSEVDTCGWT